MVVIVSHDIGGNHNIKDPFMSDLDYDAAAKLVAQDDRIYDFALPTLEKTAKSEDSTISLENRIDVNIDEPRSLIDRINGELLMIDEMLLDPKCDFAMVLQQAYRVLDLLQRLAARSDKTYALDKEPELWEQVQELKGSFNTWKVLAVAIISGVLTAAGGFLSIASIIPGTAAGQGLANAAPNVFGFLSDANNSKAISSVGEGAKLFGQGSDVFRQIFNNTDEAKRVVHNYLLQDLQRKQSDRSSAAKEARDLGTAAMSNCRAAMTEFHRVFESIMKGTTT